MKNKTRWDSAAQAPLDSGRRWALRSQLQEALTVQYWQHPNWSYQLHTDNLLVLVEQKCAFR